MHGAAIKIIGTGIWELNARTGNQNYGETSYLNLHGKIWVQQAAETLVPVYQTTYVTSQ